MGEPRSAQHRDRLTKGGYDAMQCFYRCAVATIDDCATIAKSLDRGVDDSLDSTPSHAKLATATDTFIFLCWPLRWQRPHGRL
jgi:hypothetical protein